MICLQAQAQVRLSSAAPWGWGGVSHRFHCSPQVYPAGQASNRALEAGVQSVAFETGVQSVAFRDWCAISTTPHPPAIPPLSPFPAPQARSRRAAATLWAGCPRRSATRAHPPRAPCRCTTCWTRWEVREIHLML